MVSFAAGGQTEETGGGGVRSGGWGGGGVAASTVLAEEHRAVERDQTCASVEEHLKVRVRLMPMNAILLVCCK